MSSNPTDEGELVAAPDMVDDDPSLEKIYCFLDMTRPCDPTCMAYSTHAAPNNHLPGAQRHCLVLNSAEKAIATTM